MPTYSRLVIEQTFETIWETWINKEGERAAEKAVDVLLRSGENKDDLIKACEIYRLENLASDPEFTYKLSNFINQEHWRDVLEGGDSLEKLKMKYDEATDLIDAWNYICHPHWCKTDKVTRVPVAQKALANKYFKENWKKALDKASKIFRYQMRDEDPRSKIILSFRWFTNISNDKHTVLRIMEGEYGAAVNYIDKPRKIVEIRVPTPEERAQALKDFEEAFGMKYKPKEVKKPKPIQINEQAKELTDSIIKAFGISTEDESRDDDPFGLV